MTEKPLTDDELSAIRDRHEATTKGDWSAHLEPFNGEGSIKCWVIRSTVYAGLSPMIHYPSFMAGGRCAIPEETTQANTEFAAHAHQDVPRLLDEIERLKVENSKFRDALEDIRDNFDCDGDAHKYDTTCRCCLAEEVLGEPSLLHRPENSGG